MSTWENASTHIHTTEKDPRVVPRPTASTGVFSEAKTSGNGEPVAAHSNAVALGKARKRPINGQSDELKSEVPLGTEGTVQREPTSARGPHQVGPLRAASAARPRTRAMTHNLDPVSYDAFCDWLLTPQKADNVIVQEVHCGCGKQEWRIGAWHAILSPDPKHRYCGVGIFISRNATGLGCS